MSENYIKIIKAQQEIISKLISKIECTDNNIIEQKYNETTFINDVYKVMKKTKYKNGQVRGILFLANELNTNEQSIRAAHEMLKKRNLITTKNKKTYLN